MVRSPSAQLRRVAPWLVAFLALTWLFHTVPAAKLVDALRQASVPAFSITVALFVVAVLLADVAALWLTLRRALPDLRLRYRDTLKIRAVAYLLSAIHYGVGQGGIAYLLHSRHRVPLGTAASTVLLTMAVNAVLVTACAGLGVVLGGAPASKDLRLLVLSVGAMMPAYLALIAWSPRPLARIRFLAPLLNAGVRGHLVIAMARLPHIATLIVGHYAAMRSFGVQPPIGYTLACLPLVFIVATLPLSPSGLGTSQAAAVALFAPFAPGADVAGQKGAVLAYSLSLQFTVLALHALIGLTFLRNVTGLDTLKRAADASANDRTP